MKVEQYIAENAQQVKELEDAVNLLFDNCHIIGDGSNNLSCRKGRGNIFELKAIKGDIWGVAPCLSKKDNPARIVMAKYVEVHIQIGDAHYKVEYSGHNKF